MPALAAGDVEDLRAIRGAENVDDARDFLPIALEGEERLVLEQVLRVEVIFPPVGGGGRRLRFIRSRAASCPQKNTGSRYAPNTSSIAARISYSVQ